MKKLILSLVILFSCQSAFAGGSLKNSMKTSASALQAQSKRMEIVTQNIANSETVGINPEQDPYRRKTIFFENIKDPQTGANLVRVKKISVDDSDFKLMYKPGHPAADENGYVKYPNVNRTRETLDLKEAQRSYEANISAIETSKAMMQRTLELMR